MNEELLLAIEELRQTPRGRVWFVPAILTPATVPDQPIGGGETLRDLQWVDLTTDWKTGVESIVALAKPKQRARRSVSLPDLPVGGAADYRTVTVAITLRKALFAMENVDDLGNFAEWLTQLARLYEVSAMHAHGFLDRAGGDSALIHFVVAPSSPSTSITDMSHVLDATVTLMNAVAVHVNRLRTMLRLDSQLVGLAAGIDVAPARWKIGPGNSTIVVGRGVVTAARLMDQTPAGVIRLSNIAYHELPATVRETLTAVSLFTKEYGSELQLSTWQLVVERDKQLKITAKSEAILAEVYGATQKRRVASRPRSSQKRKAG